MGAQGNPDSDFLVGFTVYRNVDQLRMEPKKNARAGLSAMKGKVIRIKFHRA